MPINLGGYLDGGIDPFVVFPLMMCSDRNLKSDKTFVLGAREVNSDGSPRGGATLLAEGAVDRLARVLFPILSGRLFGSRSSLLTLE